MPATDVRADDILAELEALGTPQNRKVYTRHGVGGDRFGVSYANLGKLTKRIGVDHDMAAALWSSRNHDARILATMVADPSRMTAKDLDGWAKDLGNYVITDAFAGLVSRTSIAGSRAERWCKARGEWVGQAGWGIVAGLAGRDAELPDAFFETYLGDIKDHIHERKNRVRHAMNIALIAIGIRNEKLQKKALVIAKHIGKVEVDHGETGCKTPDAAAYIRKVMDRKAKGK